jgi:hypothetical protein
MLEPLLVRGVPESVEYDKTLELALLSQSLLKVNWRE